MADAARAWNRLKALDIPKTYEAWKAHEAASHAGRNAGTGRPEPH